MSETDKKPNPKPALNWSGRAITGTDLKSLIEENKILRTPYSVPIANKLEDLATYLSVIRGRVSCARGKYSTKEEQIVDEYRRRASEALEILATALPKIREYEAINGPYFHGIDSRPHIVREIDEFMECVTHAWEFNWMIPRDEIAIRVNATMGRFSDAWAIPAASPTQEIHKWHHFVAALASKFCDAVTNSNKSLRRLRIGGGNATASSLVSFLVAVIPHISDETPEPSAVRRELQRIKWS